MSSRQEIERLRARAAHYRREAEKAQQRQRLIYCRALARHLEHEAAELARELRSGAPATVNAEADPAEVV
jgi:hypothetical protein